MINAGLVKMSIGMIFLGPGVRTAHILIGKMWKYKLDWHHKNYDYSKDKMRSQVMKSFTLHTISVPYVKVLMDYHIFPSGGFTKLRVIQILNTKYVMMFIIYLKLLACSLIFLRSVTCLYPHHTLL
jgi:hypothetical protein